jgi:release factor glutamine methyltransferase
VRLHFSEVRTIFANAVTPDQSSQHYRVAPFANDHQRTWTVLGLIEWATGYLADRGFDECRLHAELLLGHVLKLPRLNLYLQFDRTLEPSELSAFKQLFRRRLSHEPLQYILGETEFMGLSIHVDSTVLIPRPETELLVERALAAVTSAGLDTPCILDVGTGSANIAIALAHFLPSATILAVDVSPDSLATAAANIARHGFSNIELLRLDILKETPGDRQFDLIVSNPPYISIEEFPVLQEEIRRYEPAIATTDGRDGLVFHRRLAEISRSHLCARGSLIVEIGHGQADAVRELMHAAGLEEVEVTSDFSQIPRIAAARKPG